MLAIGNCRRVYAYAPSLGLLVQGGGAQRRAACDRYVDARCRHVFHEVPGDRNRPMHIRSVRVAGHEDDRRIQVHVVPEAGREKIACAQKERADEDASRKDDLTHGKPPENCIAGLLMPNGELNFSDGYCK